MTLVHAHPTEAQKLVGTLFWPFLRAIHGRVLGGNRAGIFLANPLIVPGPEGKRLAFEWSIIRTSPTITTQNRIKDERVNQTHFLLGFSLQKSTL